MSRTGPSAETRKGPGLFPFSTLWGTWKGPQPSSWVTERPRARKPETEQHGLDQRDNRVRDGGPGRRLCGAVGLVVATVCQAGSVAGARTAGGRRSDPGDDHRGFRVLAELVAPVLRLM